MAGRTILCVDDEPTVLSVTMNVLRDIYPKDTIMGVNVPEDAQAILSGEKVAVVISDLSMPNMDGAEILRQAHECDPNTVTILATGRASTDGLIRALNEGHLWRCLEKPWTHDQIKNLVDGALELYESRMDRKDNGGDAATKQTAGKAARGAKKMIISKQKVIRKIPKPQYRLKGSNLGRSKLRIMDKRYRDMVLLKEGGSGAVYKSYDTLLDIPVAIKIISEKISSNAAAMKELVAEARIAMGLSHKHIVRLHNIERGNNFYYLVMEYLKGETLRELLTRIGAAIDPETCLQVMAVMEEALGYAHRRGIFHRDIKPDNVMLDGDGTLKIIDFGLACLGETFRRDGEIAGTPYYMSPEEMRCEVPDQRTDVFSVGVMMHELVYGSLPPHGGEGDLEDPLNYVPVASPQLPESMQEVLQASFALDRAARWPDIHEFAAAFRRAMAAGYSVV